MEETTIFVKSHSEGSFIPAEHLITSIRTQIAGGHAHLSIWVRGGLAGRLTVDAKDAEILQHTLLPQRMRKPANG